MLACRRCQSPFALFCLVAVTLLPTVTSGEEPPSDPSSVTEKPAAKPARKNLSLPGLVINFQQQCVDIEATICLDEGMLELIACNKGSKEHESIVAIEARPMHIHTALLLLGANNGNPATNRPDDDQNGRWIRNPPRGDPVNVCLVFEAADGKKVEHPISRFVVRSDGRADGSENHADDPPEDDAFPSTFLFAGSRLRDNGAGPRQYLADLSGNVISIATFGDELLCLPGVHASANDALMWRVDGRELPKVGSPVTLRLRPLRKTTSETDKVERKQAIDGPKSD